MRRTATSLGADRAAPALAARAAADSFAPPRGADRARARTQDSTAVVIHVASPADMAGCRSQIDPLSPLRLYNSEKKVYEILGKHIDVAKMPAPIVLGVDTIEDQIEHRNSSKCYNADLAAFEDNIEGNPAEKFCSVDMV